MKKLLKNLLPRTFLDLRLYYVSNPPYKKNCPICLFKGSYREICPKCESLPRHRLFYLWWLANRDYLAAPILHFAPEESLSRRLRDFYGNKYKTADLSTDSDIRLDIENLNISNQIVGTILCHHVLEHVDDARALKEIVRVLIPKGAFVCSVPLIEAWEKTYENSLITRAEDRYKHFGQADHLRYYGRDFRARLRKEGLSVDNEFSADPETCVKYGLQRGEKIFICSLMMPTNKA